MKRQNLKLFRKQHGLTQAQMAEKLGISMAHYRNIETGIYDPSYNLMERFQDRFDVNSYAMWGIFKKV